jgi:hypothetical protein
MKLHRTRDESTDLAQSTDFAQFTDRAEFTETAEFTQATESAGLAGLAQSTPFAGFGDPVEVGYRARHLRDVPVDTEPQAQITGGSHARRLGFDVLSRMARADVATA